MEELRVDVEDFSPAHAVYDQVPSFLAWLVLEEIFGERCGVWKGGVVDYRVRPEDVFDVGSILGGADSGYPAVMKKSSDCNRGRGVGVRQTFTN